MYLSIQFKGIDIREFTPYIISILKERAFNLYWADKNRVNKWDKYLKQNYNNKYTVKKIINEYFSNLIIEYKNSNSCKITLNTNIKINNIDKIDHLSRLINYGNTEIKGYPIFDLIYNYISDNIDYIYELWNINKNVNTII